MTLMSTVVIDFARLSIAEVVYQDRHHVSKPFLFHMLLKSRLSDC